MTYKLTLVTALMSVFLLSGCMNNDNHPAHDMGERADRVNKENSADYQTSREQAAESGNQSHPAHEMDEVESLERRGN